MWFVYLLGHVFLMALVFYIDEYLTVHAGGRAKANIHRRVGSLLLMSTMTTLLGALAIWATVGDISGPTLGLLLALGSAVPLTIMFVAYFYLLALYPAYQVVPLFQMGALWMLGIELAFGGSITSLGLLGIAALVLGAYLLDAGSLRWQFPTKLVLIAIPITSSGAIALLMVRAASGHLPVPAVVFWQFVGVGALGVLLFCSVAAYRRGFLARLKRQGRAFLGLSLVNETLAQGALLFSALAVAAAPVATYVSASGGLQGVFLLALITLFPIDKRRAQVTYWHAIAIALIALGAFLIRLY